MLHSGLGNNIVLNKDNYVNILNKQIKKDLNIMYIDQIYVGILSKPYYMSSECLWWLIMLTMGPKNSIKLSNLSYLEKK